MFSLKKYSKLDHKTINTSLSHIHSKFTVLSFWSFCLRKRNDFYFASFGWYNSIKLWKWFKAKVRTSRELWCLLTYLFRSSPVPQPLCPEGWLDLSFLSVKKTQNSSRTFCIERPSYTKPSPKLLTIFYFVIPSKWNPWQTSSMYRHMYWMYLQT